MLVGQLPADISSSQCAAGAPMELHLEGISDNKDSVAFEPELAGHVRAGHMPI